MNLYSNFLNEDNAGSPEYHVYVQKEIVDDLYFDFCTLYESSGNKSAYAVVKFDIIFYPNG